MRKIIYIYSFMVAVTLLLASCNQDLTSDPNPEPDVVKTLDITVTGDQVQAPYGNVYLFYSNDVDLNNATGLGDGSIAPVIKVHNEYNPYVLYTKNGEQKKIYPISNYGSKDDGELDNVSSARYSTVHFDVEHIFANIKEKAKDKNVLVVIVLNDPLTHSWVARTIQLRRDYLIHVSVPDHKAQTYIQGNELNAKWWQVEE